MRVAVYSRKSVDTGKGESVENQVRMCREYIAGRMEGAEVTVFEDEGFSGKDLQRPRLQQMLALARRGQLDCIVCYRLDRISRSVGDFSRLIEELSSLGVAFVSIREQFDTSTPMGRAMLYIASVFAQLERETIAQRVRDNMLELSRQGRWLGGAPPTGYRADKQMLPLPEGKMRTVFFLREEPEELQMVAALYRLYPASGSLRRTCDAAEQAGLYSRSGRAVSPQAVGEILRNPVYCTAGDAAAEYLMGQGAQVCFAAADFGRGLLAYNRRGQRGGKRPVSEWIVAAGRHNGLISADRWVAVQRLLDGETPICNGYALLSGLLHCGCCGARMTAKRRSRGGWDYICSGKLRHTSDCRCPNLLGAAADAAVLRQLQTLLTVQKGESAALAPRLPDLQLRDLRQLAATVLTAVLWDGKTLQLETWADVSLLSTAVFLR